jgi:hypothetical protein
MVWTNNDSRMMGYVAGPVHGDVWTWWVGVHHDLNIGGSMNMNMPAAPASGGGTSRHEPVPVHEQHGRMT